MNVFKRYKSGKHPLYFVEMLIAGWILAQVIEWSQRVGTPLAQYVMLLAWIAFALMMVRCLIEAYQAINTWRRGDD